ncbi:synaptogyrin-2-like [Scleropages formosus]|uniref:Synaptogyrin n=1 Tax=Scleropages formosus TaxID=113540 RepID=A0A0P7UMM2_SCLFO|nr:synaptogyrin-2-like [Scleropages formosus]
MDSAPSSAFGASLAGGDFDFAGFLRRPQTVVRIVSWVFAIVVFGCITAEGYINPTIYDKEVRCMFNQNDSACHYAVGVGVLAFLACVAFFVLDIYFSQMSNVNQRKYVVTVDLVFSGVWTFLWFVCFCLLANQWSYTQNVELIPGDAARATIAFAFFSIIAWALLTYFAVKRYRQGVEDFVQNFGDPATNNATPYPPSYPEYPTGGTDSYQQPPFTTSTDPQAEGGYRAPVY